MASIQNRAAECNPDLAPDRVTIRQWLEWWFGGCDSGMVELGWKAGYGARLNNFSRHQLGDWDAIADEAVRINREAGWDIYVRAATMRERTSGYSTDKDFIQSPGLWLDLDSDSEVDRACNVKTMIRPSAYLITGTQPELRSQLWFKSESTITDATLLRNLNVRLHSLYGGDSSVVNPSTLMRLPGSISWPKPSKPGRVIELTQLYMRDDIYKVSDFEWLLPQPAVYDGPLPPLTPDQRDLQASDPAALDKIVRMIPNSGAFDDRDDWIGFGAALKGAFGEERGRILFHDFTSKWHLAKRDIEWINADTAETDRVWDSIYPPFKKGARHLLTWAAEAGIDVSDYKAAEAAKQFGFDPGPAPAPQVILKPYELSDMMRLSRLLVTHRFSVESERTLQRVRGEFFKWTGAAHYAVSDESIRSETYLFLERLLIETEKEVKQPDGSVKKEKRLVPLQPKQKLVSEVDDALKAVVRIDDDLYPPCWLDGRDGPDPADLIAFKNGVLDVRKHELLTHDPNFFTLNALPYGYDASAGEPVEWLRFLDSVWPGDMESVELLQEWFGLMLTADLRFHKMLLLIGPPRSGKGTIATVLTALLGQHNVCGPTLNSMAGTFGLQSLLGKLLGIVSDARLSDKIDKSVTVERLLSISGADSLSVDRKNKTAWEGRLSTRLMILSNELPKLTDSSGALASRFLVLRMTESFLGKEDLGLQTRLLNELPAILKWALAGRERLNQRGRFIEPSASREMARDLADIASPVGAFLRDECEVGPELRVEKMDLYGAWCSYAARRGWRSGGTEASFGKDLRAVLPALGTERPRAGTDRQHWYLGLRLIEAPPRQTAFI